MVVDRLISRGAIGATARAVASATAIATLLATAFARPSASASTSCIASAIASSIASRAPSRLGVFLMGMAHEGHLADGYGTHDGKSLLGGTLEKLAARL